MTTSTLAIPDWVGHDVERLRSTIALIDAALDSPTLTTEFSRLMAIGSLVSALKPLTPEMIARGQEVAAIIGKGLTAMTAPGDCSAEGPRR